ncbi:MAG: N-acetyltransferase [Saprospiraceae bacterium]|nr:MAG: N-acetyltransferase [Saprospiraceae bacterium]
MTNWKLRPWTPEDLGSLVKYADNFNVARYLTGHFPHPYTEKDGRRFIAMAMSAKPVNIFAVEVDGVAAGGIGVHPQQDIHCKSAELGYWLAEPFWGQGIITAAVKEMAAYSFDKFDIVRLYARPFSNNKASQRVLEKAGFELEATHRNSIFKNGEILDELVFAIVR